MADAAGGSPAERGIALYKEGNVADAMPLLRQAIEYEPERVDLHMYLGFCWAKREKWQDAEREFNKACDMDGSSADAAFFAGFAMVKQGRLREANSMFHVACLNDPNHAKAKAGYEQTKGAAAQVTTERSSAAIPGGIAGVDMSSLDLDLGMGGGSARKADPLAGALGELKQQQGGGKAATTAGKKAGCGGGIVAGLLLLGLILFFLLGL
jgi:tetratricopeptide (TPR) repeat protein